MRSFTSVPDVRVEIDVEVPDLSRFGEENENEYFSELLDIYRHKYRDHPPQLIIPTYTPALQFLLERGEEVFPGVPIVFCDADDQFVAAQQLPPHMTGITSHRDFTGTLELIAQVQPDTQRIAVIVGSSAIDKQFEQDAWRAFRPFEGRRILHRQPSLWEAHSNAIITAGIIISLQSFLIVVLWLNRVRLRRAQTALQNEYEHRRQAESDSLRLRSRLARFSKQRACQKITCTSFM